MAQNTLALKFAHHESFRLNTNSDSSPPSSINVSLLEEAESRNLEDAIAVEDANHRKRKLEETEMDENDIEVKRARQIPTVAHMINEIETYIDDHKAHVAIETSTTRETTLAPSSPDEHGKVATIESMTQPISLPFTTTMSLSKPILSTSPAPMPLLTHSLSPQHIFLARIPGSAPLKPHTIAKAASWFAKLLTDGNSTDMIEIHKTLGIRIYLEDELEGYQQLRNEAAAGRARTDAEDLADGLGGGVDMQDNEETEDEDGVDGVDGVGTGWDEKRKRSQVVAMEMNRNRSANYKHVSSKARDKPANKPTATSTVTLTSATLPIPHPNTNNRAYFLRLKHKGSKGFHGNGFYTADGTPKTPHARRKLEEKDREGAEDVVRIYE